MPRYPLALTIGLAVVGLCAACAPIELSPTTAPAASTNLPPTATVPATLASSATPPPTATTAASTSTVAPSETPAASHTTLPETVPPTAVGDVAGGLLQGGVVPPELLQQALADLTQRTGAALADVQVVEAESVLWNDGSLGCPQPGQAYTQAEVAGYRLLLSVQGQTYDYRASPRFVVLCEMSARPKP